MDRTMTRDIVLPPKLNILQIQNYLDMDILSPEKSYQQLCDHINGNDFQLYLNIHKLELHKTNDVTKRKNCLQLNRGSQCLTATDCCLLIRNINYTKPASLFAEGFNKNSTNCLLVNIVSYQGNDYYISEPRANSLGVSFPNTSFYANRDEIIQYRKDDIYKDTLNKNQLGIQYLDYHDDNLPPYIDPESEFYAKELDIAIKLHRAIFLDGYCKNEEGDILKTKTAKITSWLTQNRPNQEQSDSFLSRLSAIIAVNNK